VSRVWDKIRKERAAKKLAKLRLDVEKYEKQFQQDSSCRNLRNYNQALAALTYYEKKQKSHET
jgi:ubiquitin